MCSCLIDVSSKIVTIVLYILMNAVSVVEEARIPVEVEHIVEPQNALVIYPKHPIVKHSGAETKENTYKSNICYTASLKVITGTYV